MQVVDEDINDIIVMEGDANGLEAVHEVSDAVGVLADGGVQVVHGGIELVPEGNVVRMGVLLIDTLEGRPGFWTVFHVAEYSGIGLNLQLGLSW